MTQDRITVCIPTYNRRAVAEQCIPTVRAGMEEGDVLMVYDDGSSPDEKPWHSEAIMRAASGFIPTEPIGIDAQRRNHILEFVAGHAIHGRDWLYLTDCDAFHDPDWRRAALTLYRNYGKLTCLYRTQTHANYVNNIYRDHPGESVIWQRFAPGVSYLLSIADCRILAAHMPAKIAWDWWVPGALGHKCAVSRVSYCDHIGYGGMHDRNEPGCASNERATNATEWLVKKRVEILSNLGLKDV